MKRARYSRRFNHAAPMQHKVGFGFGDFELEDLAEHAHRHGAARPVVGCGISGSNSPRSREPNSLRDEMPLFSTGRYRLLLRRSRFAGTALCRPRILARPYRIGLFQLIGSLHGSGEPVRFLNAAEIRELVQIMHRALGSRVPELLLTFVAHFEPARIDRGRLDIRSTTAAISASSPPRSVGHFRHLYRGVVPSPTTLNATTRLITLLP